jgi:hypothetical protein
METKKICMLKANTKNYERADAQVVSTVVKKGFRRRTTNEKSETNDIHAKMSNGSPVLVISVTVDFKSKTFARTILNIFWTLIECEADEKTRGAFIALAYFLANLSISSISSGGRFAYMSYLVPTRKAWAV